MLFFNALKSISSVYVYSISPVAESSNLLMSIKYFLLSSFKVFGGIPNRTIQHILTFHLIYFNTLTLERQSLPIAKMYAVLLHSRRWRKKRNNILVSRPRLAKSAQPRDQWPLIAKELIDREVLNMYARKWYLSLWGFFFGFQNNQTSGKNAFFIARIGKDDTFLAKI